MLVEGGVLGHDHSPLQMRRDVGQRDPGPAADPRTTLVAGGLHPRFHQGRRGRVRLSQPGHVGKCRQPVEGQAAHRQADQHHQAEQPSRDRAASR